MLAKQVSDMEKGTSKLVDKYMDSVSPDALQCVLNWYGSWADAHALLAPAVNYTGNAVCKLAMARRLGQLLRLLLWKAPTHSREGRAGGTGWVSMCRYKGW